MLHLISSFKNKHLRMIKLKVLIVSIVACSNSGMSFEDSTMEETGPRMPWAQHGWWLTAEDSNKVVLWITIYPIIEGHHATALGKRFGEVINIRTLPSHKIYITCKSEPGCELEPTLLSKRFVFKPVPTILLKTPRLLNHIDAVKRGWTSTHPDVRVARRKNVDACMGLSQEQRMHLARLMKDHTEFEALKVVNPVQAASQGAPAVPIEDNPIFRVFAKPHVLDYKPLSYSSIPATSLQEASQEQPVARAANVEGSCRPTNAEGRGRPSKRARSASQNIASTSHDQPTSSNAAIDSSFGRNPSLRGGRSRMTGRGETVLEGGTPRSVVVPDATVGGSVRRGSTTRVHRVSRTGRGSSRSQERPSTSTAGASVHISPVDDESLYYSDEDANGPDRDGAIVPGAAPLRSVNAPVPTRAEIAKGSLWGEIEFYAHIDQIIAPRNPDTNHRLLSEKRVSEVYNMLHDHLKRNEVAKLVLRPVKYIVRTTSDDGRVQMERVSFPTEGTAQEFTRVYNLYAPTSGHDSEASKITWLQEHIIWEPVDGQHVVAACKLAQEHYRTGTLNRFEYESTYMKRRSSFVVFDDPIMYILKSVRLNMAAHTGKHLSTMSQDLKKLREIWEYYGKPNSLIRTDDVRRARALVAAASAVQRIPKDDEIITTKTLASRLVNLTHQAWNPSDECFEAILQVCKDYENGHLFHSKGDETRWKELANKKDLDVLVDTRPNRLRITPQWFKPLTRIPDSLYLGIIKSCAAKAVRPDGIRPPQKYYFDGVEVKDPKSQTLSGAVERIMGREAVKNMIRYLMVENGAASLRSTEEFFVLSVSKYFPGGLEQLQDFGTIVSPITKTKWAAPEVKNVSELDDIRDLIPAIIISHFEDVAQGGVGYYTPPVPEDLQSAQTWEWKMNVKLPVDNDAQDTLLVRYRRGLFRRDTVLLKQSYLWVIDCRRGGGRYGDGVWADDQYVKIIEQLKLWMSNIDRWNVVFLLSPGVYYTADMLVKLKLPVDCSYLRGCWTFRCTPNDYPQNIKEASSFNQAVEATGDVLIYLHHPTNSTAKLNIVASTVPLPLVFHDRRGNPRRPVQADPLERSPIELARLVRAYMPRGWGLVACNIGTAVPTILTSTFKGNDVIVIDDCRKRDSFIHDQLSQKLGGELVIPRRVAMSPRNRAGVGAISEGDPMAPTHDNTEAEYERLGFNIRRPRDRTPTSSTSKDDVSPAASGGHEDDEEVATEEGDGGTDFTVSEYDSVPEPESEGPPTELHTSTVVPSTPQSEVVATKRTLRTETDGEETIEDDNRVSQTQQDGPSIGMEAGDHTLDQFHVIQRLVGRPSGETPLEQGSMMQGEHDGTQSTSGASFQETFGSGYSFRDGFYLDADGIRHVRRGESGNYTYEQHTSVGTSEGSVPDDVVDDMVENALSHATGLSSM